MKPTDYKEDEFIHLIYQGQEKEDATEIPFNELEKINLNQKGQSIPYTVRNVVNLERYMLRYWQPIIGSDAVFLYLNLWEYCDKDNGIDLCYPKIKELTYKMNKDHKTIKKNLKVLEENNFILVVHRLNRTNNRETSPVFKLRQTIPMLSREQYHSLNEYLRKQHDEYVEKFINDSEFRMDMFSYDVNETFEYLKQKGDIIVSSKTRQEINDILKKQEEEEYLLSILPETIKCTLMNNQQLIGRLIEGSLFSKPVAETYFHGCISLYDQEHLKVVILTKDKSQSEFLNETLSNQIQFEKVMKSFNMIYEQDVFEVTYIPFKQFVINFKKGK